MKKKLKCLDCGSEDLNFYEEKVIATYRKITKDNKVSKRVDRIYEDSYSSPWGIYCNKCSGCFSFDTDEKDRIVSINHK